MPRLPWTPNRAGSGRAEGMVLLALANMSHDLHTLSSLALPRSQVPWAGLSQLHCQGPNLSPLINPSSSGP